MSNYSGPKARVMIVADKAWSSRLIERVDGWSHYANVLHDGQILDARSDRIGHVPPGVQLRKPHYLDSVPKWVLYELPTRDRAQYQRWEAAGRSQLKKPYDKLGILDFFTGASDVRNWRDQSAWFCDELGVWMLEESDHCRELPSDIYKLTPGAALLLVIGLGARLISSRG